MLNKILPIIAIVAIIFAGVVVSQQKPDKSEIKPVKNPPEISAKNDVIAATGVIETASEEINIAPHISGVVDDVFVRVGDEIKKDEPLFLIDIRASLANLDAAESQINISESALETARSKFEFYNNIKNKDAISREELINRKNKVIEAQAQLSQARAKLAQARTDLELHLVKSPINGKILKINIKKGEFANATSDKQYIIVGDVSDFNVRAEIDEYNIANMQKNADAYVILRGNSEEKIKAKFLRIEPLVQPKRNLSGERKELVDTRILQVIFKLEKNPKSIIYAGQQADVYITK